MSKLAVFLFTVLFVSAVSAGSWSDGLKEIQEKVIKVIADTIETIKQKTDEAIKQATEFAEKIQASAEEFGKKLYEEVKATLEKVREEIEDILGNSDGVDVSECQRFLRHLEETSVAVIGNMSTCVVDKIETSSGYIHNIIATSNNALESLNEISEKVTHCADNVNGIASAAEAVLCVNLAAANATWVAAKATPAITLNLSKLTYLFTTLQPSLALCTTKNGLVTFYYEAATIAQNTRECVKEKINEARSTTPKIEEPTTTPAVSAEKRNL